MTGLVRIGAVLLGAACVGLGGWPAHRPALGAQPGAFACGDGPELATYWR